MNRSFGVEELRVIADEREQWALQAHNNDLHGSAKEWEMVAAIARQLIEWMEKSKS